MIDRTGKVVYRNGAFKLKDEELVGGWCSVYVSGYKVPVRSEVSLDEYIGRKKDGTINTQWSSKSATMIRKVAKMQALREAFPDDFQGMYSKEEVESGDIEFSETTLSDMPEIPKAAAPTTVDISTYTVADQQPPIEADFNDLLEE